MGWEFVYGSGDSGGAGVCGGLGVWKGQGVDEIIVVAMDIGAGEDFSVGICEGSDACEGLDICMAACSPDSFGLPLPLKVDVISSRQWKQAKAIKMMAITPPATTPAIGAIFNDPSIVLVGCGEVLFPVCSGVELALLLCVAVNEPVGGVVVNDVHDPVDELG